MSRDEVLALGVPEEKYAEFQELYNRDLNCRVTSRTAKNAKSDTLSAILAMLKLIEKPETLDGILKYINNAYYREC